jgi:hypothetical protein
MKRRRRLDGLDCASILGDDRNRSQSRWLLLARERADVRVGSRGEELDLSTFGPLLPP